MPSDLGFLAAQFSLATAPARATRVPVRAPERRPFPVWNDARPPLDGIFNFDRHANPAYSVRSLFNINHQYGTFTDHRAGFIVRELYKNEKLSMAAVS